MTSVARKPSQSPRLPSHEFAAGHHLTRAVREHANKRRLRDVADLQSSGEVAAQRIREFAYDVGADVKHARGWMAYAARKLGVQYTTLYAVINMGRGKSKKHRRKSTVGTRTVDQIARFTGCPIAVFYDPELR
jgi:hypothetical protein